MITGAYEKAKKYIEAHSYNPHEEKRIKGPCITFSRDTGAGADKVSEILCEKLQHISKEDQNRWTVFDRNLIEKIIEDHHFPSQIASFLEEGKRSEINSYISELLGLQPSSLIVIKKTAETILQIASLGNVIIVGRGATVITTHIPLVFHVRLTAPMEDRIKHIQELFKLSYKDADEHIRKDDEHRRLYLMKYYGKDISDPHLYHLTINTHLINYNDAAELIRSYITLKFPQYFKEGV